MPVSALANVHVDHVAPTRELGSLLARLAELPLDSNGEPPRADSADLEREVNIAALEDKAGLAALRVAAARDREEESTARRLIAQRETAQSHAAVLRELIRFDIRVG